ncbi:DUF6058 family natural product biosynthesis protein [Xanthomonas codiaei]|uniref:DUF6058 family natural product biosynthesis protein n=1 Tax=Xanthomonas codiaei TaxID=56463 RepID=A0A2S7CPY5_9XANT|nr:DUF6058 family natural product biosynthesis protein [Xanthomonas codiaei]PPU63559.1 hypothetical protein XcodCFBP4690_12460 [Xanthomonas codiaei]
MSDLEAYLDHHYRTAEQLAAACAISPETLTLLVNERLVPEPSYTVTEDGRFISQAFGEFQVHALAPGRYFHPGNAAWVVLALEARASEGAQRAHTALKERFRRNFAAALMELDKTVYRLPDSFTETGSVIAEGLDKRTESAWHHFLKGVFSLCVADVSSEASIARKEVLQEALIEMSDNGSKDVYSAEQRRQCLDTIGQYEAAAMPFSPLEYSRSSRKRLVEDLRPKLQVR